MKPNLNGFQIPGVNPPSGQYRQNNPATDYKDWDQQPAIIMELLTKEDMKLYGAVMEFRKRMEKGGATRIQLRGPAPCSVTSSQPKIATFKATLYFLPTSYKIYIHNVPLL